MAGDAPPGLSGFCGANVDGTLYVFAGCHNNQCTNEVGDVSTVRRRSNPVPTAQTTKNGPQAPPI